MSRFTWSQIYSVGNDKIDQQHQQLFDIANRYADALERGMGRKTLIGIFNELVAYTAYHFKEEESMLQDGGYPELEAHRKNHEKLVKLVMHYKQQLDMGEAGVEQRALDFIQTWLNGHILGMDRKYREYLK
jgi:hemerythrin